MSIAFNRRTVIGFLRACQRRIAGFHFHPGKAFAVQYDFANYLIGTQVDCLIAGRHGNALAGIARQHLIQYRTLGGAGAVDGYVCMNTQLLVTEESACCLHRRFMNLPGSLDMMVGMSVIFGAFA